jgi:SAM-dependent methyltransferase
MVVGKDFIWAHLGKTGGDSTHRMFSLISTGDMRIDKNTDRQKHVNFVLGARRFNVSLSTRKRIMNIRRLPFWLLSHNQHIARTGSIEFSSEQLTKGIARHRGGDKTADEILQVFESDKVNHWIRTEYLSSDFIRIMSHFMVIPQYVKEKISAVWVNSASYEKNLGVWFDNDMLATLYNNNPRWRDLELRLYGELVRICNICGETRFVSGPKGRRSETGNAPCCSNCKSVERDRAYREVFECFKKNQEFSQQGALQIGNDLSVDQEWFGSFAQSMFDEDGSQNLIEPRKGAEGYDVIICNYILQRVRDDRKALRELVQFLSPDGFVFLTIPAPISVKKTTDWGYPDKARHGHYRFYGTDVEDLFREELNDAYVIRHTHRDPVTGADERVYLICLSGKCFHRLINSLDSHEVVCKPREKMAG